MGKTLKKPDTKKTGCPGDEDPPSTQLLPKRACVHEHMLKIFLRERFIHKNYQNLTMKFMKKIQGEGGFLMYFMLFMVHVLMFLFSEVANSLDLREMSILSPEHCIVA
jgi:hypothetical protein